MQLLRSIPALPVRKVSEAIACYRDRFGFRVHHEADAATVIAVQPWGVREFAALDHERNLLTFFERI